MLFYAVNKDSWLLLLIINNLMLPCGCRVLAHCRCIMEVSQKVYKVCRA